LKPVEYVSVVDPGQHNAECVERELAGLTAERAERRRERTEWFLCAPGGLCGEVLRQHFESYFAVVAGITALPAMSQRPPCRTSVFMYWPRVAVPAGGVPPVTS
jgi:hypothetical protein